MGKIQVLDQVTIDKIAAGEVVERPASVVKELVENAIDAKATAVEVEIQDGGISLIRIADNGGGMEQEDVRNAFLRHSTSKIRKVDDLAHISSLGFRGEALSSIAAVCQVEMITKTEESVCGTAYQISGGKEVSLEETGARDGTTFLVRQLFYNVPARRKFLKTPMTEASHVSDLMTRLALSRPDISFQFINNGQERMHTSGNGKLKDVIYHVYGREITANLIEVSRENGEIRITGFIGNPTVTRAGILRAGFCQKLLKMPIRISPCSTNIRSSYCIWRFWEKKLTSMSILLRWNCALGISRRYISSSMRRYRERFMDVI